MSALAIVGGIARALVRRALHLYYPRIGVEGRERIPANGAVLFVVNHPNSLMDPAVIGFVKSKAHPLGHEVTSDPNLTILIGYVVPPESGSTAGLPAAASPGIGKAVQRPFGLSG